MTDYRTFDELNVKYLAQNPQELDDFLSGIFDDYAWDGDSAALLSALRTVARVKGISKIAKEVGMSRQGLQKALSANGNPRLDSISAIMRAMGYKLMPRRLL